MEEGGGRRGAIVRASLTVCQMVPSPPPQEGCLSNHNQELCTGSWSFQLGKLLLIGLGEVGGSGEALLSLNSIAGAFLALRSCLSLTEMRTEVYKFSKLLIM